MWNITETDVVDGREKKSPFLQSSTSAICLRPRSIREEIQAEKERGKKSVVNFFFLLFTPAFVDASFSPHEFIRFCREKEKIKGEERKRRERKKEEEEEEEEEEKEKEPPPPPPPPRVRSQSEKADILY